MIKEMKISQYSLPILGRYLAKRNEIETSFSAQNLPGVKIGAILGCKMAEIV